MENPQSEHGRLDSSNDRDESLPYQTYDGKILEVLDRISDAFYAVDSEWRFTFVNRRAEEFWGCSREQLLGQNIWKTFPQAVGSELYRLINRTMEEGVTTEFETVSPVSGKWIAGRAYPSPDGLSVYFQDIAHPKHAEEALYETNRRIENILESITEDFFAVDREWRYTYINERALRRIQSMKGEGLTRRDLLGKSSWEVFPEQVGSVFYHKYHEALREQKTIHFEEYLPQAEEWYVCFAYPSEEGLAAYRRDITERKRTAEKLRQSEERLRTQYHSFPVPTFSWRKVQDDFELVDYNEAADKITQSNLADMMGMRASQWYADKSEILGMLQRCFEEGITIHEEIPWQMRTTGEHKHFAVTFAYVSPDLVIHYAEDITERKRAEEALEESHTLLRSIIEGTPDAIFLKDIKGRYLMANSSAAKIVGQPAQELLGKDNTELMPPQVTRRIVDVDRHVMETGEFQTGEEQLPVEGTTRTYLFTKAPYRDHRGEVAGVIGIARDITERKRLEENQQRFLANAAHQLKTPITTIAGAAELLVTKQDLEATKKRQLLDHIYSEGRHMQQLSDTLLRLAKVGWDGREPDLEVVDLAAAGRQAAKRIVPLAESTGLSLRLAGDSARVLADPAWLQEVLLILLSNAVKYSNPGREITLRLLESAIIVEDEGAGISSDDLPHVFERFYKGKGSVEGFGLGLSICRELVERMGGRITLSSAHGVGTTVKLELPKANVDA